MASRKVLMSARWISWGLLLVVASACGSSRWVRLETGEGPAREYAAPSWNKSVKIHEDEFEEALGALVLEMPLAIRSMQARWLVRTSHSAHEGDMAWHVLLRRSHGGVCAAAGPSQDCLSPLEDVGRWGDRDRLMVALGLSLRPLKRSIAEAVKETLTPQLFYAAAVTGLVTWVALAAAPEPMFTKAAAVVAAVMMAYLGVDAFLEVLKASVELKRATDVATTVEDLERAGQRFGQTLGTQGARVFILAVTVAVSRGTGGTATWLAARMPLLPRFPEAAALAAAQVGLRLSAVEQVGAVAVVEGQLALTLAPTAVAMAVTGSGGASSGGPGTWVQVNESMSASARKYQAQVTGAPEGSAYRVKGGGEQADFDGYRDGVLLEAKGPGYAKFIDEDLDPVGFFKGADKVVEQARRQWVAAEGGPIRWLVAEEKFAAALRKLFRFNDIGIEIIHVPQV
ncbi:Restriction endonuclease fold toxin 5 [Stigmatella aurantiaca]|uniref:Restriction endonuclease fold toxin 5 n=1 Tax=Stigmatella aurantiaca TaxID=41 RepID=A0A1H7L8F5_STIAU|nr:Restriction endonuclease fold toxin 5 [Stigmatella aurantiaca]